MSLSRRRTHRVGVGTYRASEIHYVTYPSDVALASCRLVVFHHGSGQSTLQVSGSTGGANHLLIVRSLLEAGYALASFDFGGASTWGNSDDVTSWGQAMTFLSGLGIDTGQVAVWGESMGHLSTFNFAHDNSTDVVAGWGTLPVSDAVAYHTANPANMDAAWGGDWTANGGPATDPMALAATFPNIPWRLYYATDDTLVPPSTVTTLAPLLPDGQAISMGTGGHSSPPLANIDRDDLVAWLDAAAWS